MYKLLVNMFVKDKDNIKDSKVRKQYGTLASIFGLVSNVFLVLLKLIIGAITGSIAIIGDAINNATDSASSFISLIGFKFSNMPADKKHPYGHQRLEQLCAFVVSIIVCVLGGELITSSIDKMIHPDKIPSSIVLTSIILGISILIKVYQSWFYSKVGKTISSSALKATAVDSRNDVIATSSVLVGLVISYFIGFNLDGYLGIVVGIMVMLSGIKLVKETSSPLLGIAPSETLINNLMCEINNNEIILGVHDLNIHSYGPDYTFASVDVEVDSKLSMLEVHEVIDMIERTCKEKYKTRLVVHVDPVVVGDTFTDEMKEKMVSILDMLPFTYSIHDFRVVKYTNRVNVIFDIVIPYDCKMKKKEIVEYIQTELRKIDENYYLILTIDN